MRKFKQKQLDLGITDFGKYTDLAERDHLTEAERGAMWGSRTVLTLALLFTLIRSQFGHVGYMLPAFWDSMISMAKGDLCKSPEQEWGYHLDDMYPELDPVELKNNFLQNIDRQYTPSKWEGFLTDEFKGFFPVPPPEAVSFISGSCINTSLFPGVDVYDPAQELTLKIAFRNTDNRDIEGYEKFVIQAQDVLEEFNQLPGSRLHVEFVDSNSDPSVLTFFYGIDKCGLGPAFAEKDMGGCSVPSNRILIANHHHYVDDDTIRHEFMHAVLNAHHLFNGEGREFEDFFGTESMSVMSYSDDTSLFEDVLHYKGWGFLDRMFINAFIQNSGPYGPVTDESVVILDTANNTIVNANPSTLNILRIEQSHGLTLSLDPRFMGMGDKLYGTTQYFPQDGGDFEIINLLPGVLNATVLLGTTDNLISDTRTFILSNDSTEFYYIQAGSAGNNTIVQSHDNAKPVELSIFFDIAQDPLTAQVDTDSNTLLLSNARGDSFRVDFSKGIMLTNHNFYGLDAVQHLYINDSMDVEQINALLSTFGTKQYTYAAQQPAATATSWQSRLAVAPPPRSRSV